MTVIATRPCVTCGRGFPVPANNPAKRYCTPRCQVADWRHRHPGHTRRQPASRRDAANAVSSPNAVAPGDAVPRCPHCGRAWPWSRCCCHPPRPTSPSLNRSAASMANHPSRDAIGTTSPAATRRCPVCTATFTPVRRQAYCSERCRKSACRRRHAAPPAVVVPPTRTRREITVYACPECETRYLGEQWCHDCVRPCIRVGPGGACPHGDELVAVTDLLDTPTGTEVVTTPR